MPPQAQAATPGNDIQYTYDEAGRLTGVIDPASDAARFAYDPAGNILSIARQSSSTTSIIEFAPAAGPAGTTVTIHGTGYSATPSQNTVKFNGTTATVASATKTELVVTVPAGATTGPISVTSPAGSATSAEAFTVGVPGAPTISGFTPVVGGPDTTLAISGGNFEAVPANNKVTLNTMLGPVTSATTTTIQAGVPPAATSGRITVVTPAGKAVSADDFFVPPPGFTAADVEFTGRLAAGGTKTATVSTPGKIGLIVFDGEPGQRVSLKLSGLTVSHWLTIFNPDGTALVPRGWISSFFSSEAFIDTLTLPSAGTYTILFDPDAATTGSATFALYDVPPDATATITPGGSPVTVTTTVPGQNAKVTFDGIQNQRVSLKVTGVTIPRYVCCSGDVSILNPDGTALQSPASFDTDGVYIDTRTLPVTGTYTIVVDPRFTNTGSATLTLYDVPPDATATITPGGPPVTVTTTVPGQNAKVTFDGVQNRRVSLKISGVTIPQHACCSGDVSILNPDGTPLAPPTGFPASGGFVDTRTLPVTGTYTIVIDPRADNSGTGSVTLTLYDVPADATATMAVGGPSVTLTMTVPGHNGKATFTGTGGQQVTLNITNVTIPGLPHCCSAWVSILNPDGTTLVSPTNVGTDGRSIQTQLAATGTHTIVVDPQESATGSMTLALTAGGALGLTTTTKEDGEVGVVDPSPGPEAAETSSAGGKSAGGQGAGGSTDPKPGQEGEPGGIDREASRTGAPEPGAEATEDPDGDASVEGEVRTVTGQPLEGVTLSVGKVRSTSDERGRFVLTGLASGQHVVTIDGTAAGEDALDHGIFQVNVDLAKGRRTTLPYTVWMPRIDTAHAVRIPSPTTSEVVVTNPRLPGLELHIPPETVITDLDGNPVTELSITPVTVSRPPFPIPPQVPLYFTIQPGGAVASKPVRLVYPNDTVQPPGGRVNFIHYHLDGRGWHIYGLGTVSDDGDRIVPNYGVGFKEFTGAMINSGDSPPADGPVDGGEEDGDPVDLATGKFVLRKTDLVLPGPMRLALTRTYRPGDPNSRAFGIGTNHRYGTFLWSAQAYQEVDLVRPHGGRIHYVRISPGTGFSDAVFETTTTPGAFHKSRITWNGNAWDLTLRNGTVYVFGENAPLQSIRDRNGNKITLTRTNGQSGNITRIASSSGRWIKLSYDASNRITRAEDNTGRAVVYTYDAGGRLWKVTDAAGGVTEYAYDPSGRMSSITDPRTIPFLTNEYDANGRVSRQIQADGSIFRFAYTLDQNGKVTQTEVTGVRGFLRRVTFNGSGFALTNTRAVGKPEEQTTTFTREPGTNLITEVTDPLERRTTFEYNGKGLVTRITRLAGTPDAVSTSLTYEPDYSQVATIRDPLDHVTRFDYGAKGRLLSATNPLGKAITFTYTAAGQVRTVTDPLGNTTTYSYEGGDLAAMTDPVGRTTIRFTDGAGRLVAATDPLGNTTRYAYDPLNQLTRVTDPLGGPTAFTYDPNGNLKTVTDPRQNAWTNFYNDMDRLESRTDPLGAVEAYEYDRAGNLTKLTDRRGKVSTFTYDPLNRRTFAGFGLVGETYESTVSYTYDRGNRLRTVVDSVSGTITRGYDGLDRLTSEATPQGTVSYAYDDTGRRTSMTVPGQSALTYTYDDADRLTGLARGSLAVGIAYDDASRPTSLTLPGGVVQDYAYDRASHLTGITYRKGGTTLGALAYGYDPRGLRSTVGGSFARTGIPPAVSSATYNAANRLTAWGGTALGYDPEGNLTSFGTTTYTWDARGQLASISGGTSLGYDGFGRRIGKTVTIKGKPTTTGYLHDGATPVQELTGGTPSANLLTGPGLDQFFARTTTGGAGVTRSFLTDALGSTVALADGAGAIKTSYTYEPFGKATASGSTDANTFQFTGRENDGTGLSYHRARYHSPTLGRFISEDPIGFGGGDANLYAYGGNSPPNFTDPSGLFVSPDTAIDVGFVAFDIHNLVTGGRKEFDENLGALALDLFGLLLPGVFGLGMIARYGDDAVELSALAAKAGASGRIWPSTADEMEILLEFPGKRIPDGPLTPGRGKVIWEPNSKTKITFEQHPYDPNAPDWHRGPHWHLDTPGKRHQRYVPGDPIPGYDNR